MYSLVLSARSHGNLIGVHLLYSNHICIFLPWLNNFFDLFLSTQGRAQYTMQFSHYDKVPQNVQDEVTKKLA